MTKQVALSEEAYARLRRAKRETESFSEVVLRLLDTSPDAREDPASFADLPHRFLMTMEEHLEEVRLGREEEEDPWDAGA